MLDLRSKMIKMKPKIEGRPRSITSYITLNIHFYDSNNNATPSDDKKHGYNILDIVSLGKMFQKN